MAATPVTSICQIAGCRSCVRWTPSPCAIEALGTVYIPDWVVLSGIPGTTPLLAGTSIDLSVYFDGTDLVILNARNRGVSLPAKFGGDS